MPVYTPNQFASDVLAATAAALEQDQAPATLQATVQKLVAQFLAPGDPVLKVDEDQHMVWGWASVAVEKGQPVYDLQGDVIDMGDLQGAVHQFMADERVSKEMHQGPVRGTVVDSMVFTKSVQDALGIDLGREGWYVGVHVDDPATWERVKKGELQAFSIGGSGEREPVDKTWSDAARIAALQARHQKLNTQVQSTVRSEHALRGGVKGGRIHHSRAWNANADAFDAMDRGDHTLALHHVTEGEKHMEAFFSRIPTRKARTFGEVLEAQVDKTWSPAARAAALEARRQRMAEQKAEAQIRVAHPHIAAAESAAAHANGKMEHLTPDDRNYHLQRVARVSSSHAAQSSRLVQAVDQPRQGQFHYAAHMQHKFAAEAQARAGNAEQAATHQDIARFHRAEAKVRGVSNRQTFLNMVRHGPVRKAQTFSEVLKDQVHGPDGKFVHSAGPTLDAHGGSLEGHHYSAVSLEQSQHLTTHGLATLDRQGKFKFTSAGHAQFDRDNNARFEAEQSKLPRSVREHQAAQHSDHAASMSARAEHSTRKSPHFQAALAHDTAAAAHTRLGNDNEAAFHRYKAGEHRFIAHSLTKSARTFSEVLKDQVHGPDGQFGGMVHKATPPNPDELAAQLREAQRPLPHAPGAEKTRADMIAAHAKTHAHLTTEQSAALLKPRSKIPLSADEMEAHMTAHAAAGGKRDRAAVEAEQAEEEAEQQRLGMAGGVNKDRRE